MPGSLPHGNTDRCDLARATFRTPLPERSSVRQLIQPILDQERRKAEEIYDALSDETRAAIANAFNVTSREQFAQQRATVRKRDLKGRVPDIVYLGGDSPAVIADTTYATPAIRNKENADHFDDRAIKHERVKLIFYDSEQQHKCTLWHHKSTPIYQHTTAALPEYAEPWKATRSPPYQTIEETLKPVDDRNAIPQAMQEALSRFG